MDKKTKICCICDQEKDAIHFSKDSSRKDGFGNKCKHCFSAYKKRNKPSIDRLRERWEESNKVRMSEYRKKYHKTYSIEIKQEVFSHYCSGDIRCVQCGFQDIRALTIDHVLNDGAEERRKFSGSRRNFGGSKLYAHLKKHNYPEGYQVLCFNCNVIKYRNHLEDCSKEPSLI